MPTQPDPDQRATTAPVEPNPPPGRRPILPPEVPQFFAPVRQVLPDRATLLYQPRLLGAAQVRFTDAKRKVDALQEVLVLTEITDRALPVDWAATEEPAFRVQDLTGALADADYAPCAAAASQAKNYAAWAKDFRHWLQQVARERRDAAAEKLRQSYAPRLAALQERLRRAQAAREREAAQANRAKLNAVVSLGSTLLGAFLGRKTISDGPLQSVAQ